MKNDLVKTFFTKKEDGDMRFSLENRMKFLEKHGLSDKSGVLMKQIHGFEIVVVNDDYESTECDGLITDKKDVALFVRAADCIPVLFFDFIKEVIAVAHAGREGGFQNIAGKMIQKFQDEYNSKPEDITIELGPSAGVCCYEVGNEINKHLDFVCNNYGEKYISDLNIDLPEIIKFQLLNSGVNEKNISVSQVCTLCSGKDYFSYRKNQTSDRFAGVICLK